MGEVAPNSAHFYDALGDDYDAMTGDAHRWKTMSEQYQAILNGTGAKRVLDAGCGSGGEALSLAAFGVEVIGVDASTSLVSLARNKAAANGANVLFEVADLRQLQPVPDCWADLTICRGNTLPHLLESEDIRQALKSLARVTQPGGLLILSWLNYIPILRDKRRLIGASRASEMTYLRFYDFPEEGGVVFNIVRMKGMNSNRDTGKSEVKWSSVTLTPWSADDVGMMLLQTGWEDLEIGSDLSRNEFDPENSKDVVYFAIRV